MLAFYWHVRQIRFLSLLRLSLFVKNLQQERGTHKVIFVPRFLGKAHNT